MPEYSAKKRFTASPKPAANAFVELKRPERLIKLLRQLLTSGDERKIESMLVRVHPADIAKLITLLKIEHARQLIRILFKLRKGAATVSELPSGFREELLEGLDAPMMAEFARRVDPDDAADILEKLPEERLQDVLRILDIEEVQELRALMAYAEDSAGAIMNPEFFSLRPDISVDAATEIIREQGEELREVFFVFVLSEDEKIVGMVSMREMLLAHGDSLLGDICDSNVVTVTPDTPEETVADQMAKYDLVVVAVVDNEDRMIGVVTVDDIIDVLKEAATEDLYSMVALDEDDRVFSTPGRSVALRLPWLTLNFVTALAAAFTVSMFENLIGQVVALAAMMPIVAGMGGNSGSQTLTVVIRGLALGELQPVNARKAVLKEVTVGVLNGLVLGAIGGLFGWLWKGQWWLGVLLGSAILLNLCVAALGGAVIPLLLRRMRLDPALGSQIFLTTLTDVFGFFAFLGLAAWLLPRIGVI